MAMKKPFRVELCEVFPQPGFNMEEESGMEWANQEVILFMAPKKHAMLKPLVGWCWLYIFNIWQITRGSKENQGFPF